MSYHFYDMGFKDGYKKALNEQQLAAPQTAMQPTMPGMPGGGPLPSRTSGGEGGSHNRGGDAHYWIKKLELKKGHQYGDVPSSLNLNQFLDYLGAVLPDDLQRWLNGEIEADSVDYTNPRILRVVIDGVEYALYRDEDGNIISTTYTDANGVYYNHGEDGNINHVSYPNGTAVHIHSDGGIVVYPYGYPMPDGSGSEFHYTYNPLTGQWSADYR